MYGDETKYGDYLADWLKGKRYSISPQTLKASESYIRSQIRPLLGDYTLPQRASLGKRS